jgi:uncharacterized membrane protein YphA (DoxX/SURF4 family)
MSQNYDHADSEVTGISRYIPTTLSKTILGSLIPSGLGAFVLVRQNPEWFAMQELPPVHQTAVAISAGLVACLLLAIVVIVDLSILINSKKHGRIYHYVNKKR